MNQISSKFILTGFFIFIFSTIDIHAQTILTLHPSEDVPIGFHDNFNSANQNAGNSTYYGCFWQPGASGGLNGGRSLMKFDFSSIPSGTVITSATLSLYGIGPISTVGAATSVGSTGANASLLERITSSWSEMTVTWNTQPTHIATDSVLIAASSSTTQDYASINVTQLTQNMLDNASTSFGYMLKLANENPTAGLFFCSTDYADSTKWPKLIITYACVPQIFVMHPSADVPVGFHDNFNSANQNAGTATYFGCFWQPGASGGLNGGRSLMNFDFSSFSVGTTIASATLDLFGIGPISTVGAATSVGSTGANSSVLTRVTSNWSEMAVTWNTQPTHASVDSIVLPASTSATQNYSGIDVTQLIQDIINNPTNNYGIMLKLANENPTAGLFFCSRDYADSTKWPKLTIHTCSVNENAESVAVVENNLSIYPNPSSQLINIPAIKDAVSEIRIFTITGKLVIKTEAGTINKLHNIDVSGLSNGMYFIQVISEMEIISGKFEVLH